MAIGGNMMLKEMLGTWQIEWQIFETLDIKLK
jgi:hypothetical protein